MAQGLCLTENYDTEVDSIVVSAKNPYKNAGLNSSFGSTDLDEKSTYASTDKKSFD